MSIIKKWSYYNEKDNAIAIKIGKFITLYFSYDTLIAFERSGILHISENEFKNDWGNTSHITGRHLKAIRLIYKTSVLNPKPIITYKHNKLMVEFNTLLIVNGLI